MPAEWMVVGVLVLSGVLLWKAFDTIKILFDPHGRADERTSLLELIDRLAEKNRTSDPVGTYQLHSKERMETIRQKAFTEREAMKKPAPDPVFESQDIYDPITHE